MVFEEKHHMPWAYDAYEAYEPNFREDVVNASYSFHRGRGTNSFHRLRTVPLPR